jgi:hypothetical protein
MGDTPLLVLPTIESAQAQKHLVHNDALYRLDGLAQLSVISRALATPPGSFVDGDRYLIAASPTAAWAGQAGKVAISIGGGWVFMTPRNGWVMWIVAESKLVLYDGTSWLDLLGSFSNLSFLGVNTTADATNRLAVSSDAVLLNHAGTSIQLKLNKNAAGNTASLLYQTSFSGRAEMGLTGDDDFRIKVSPDGSTWRDGIQVDRNTGAAIFANTALVRQAVNQSLSAQGPGFAADTYLAGSNIAIPVTGLKAGSRYRLVFDVTKTAAGVAAPILTLRFGTGGSTADAALAALTFPAQTAAADTGRFALEVTFRSVGSGTAAVVQAMGSLIHGLAATGLSVSSAPVQIGTSAGFNSTPANSIIGVSVNGGASAAWTVSIVQASLENLA